MQDDIVYSPEEHKRLHDSIQSSARTLSEIVANNWNYPVTQEDNLFSDNCFPGRCWKVPYVIHPGGGAGGVPPFGDEGVKRIRDAMNEIELNTCI